MNSKIHIALDSYFFFERDNFNKIKEFLDENNISNEIYQIIPFSHEIQPALPTDVTIVPFGCIEFVQAIRKLDNVTSVVFYDENIFTNENCLNQWKELCLNHDAKIMSVKEAIDTLEDRQYFMRPIEDLKSFAGNLFEPGHLPSLLERYGGYENNTFNVQSKIIVSSPKEIENEWRVFIVDGQVVSSSLYRKNRKFTEAGGEIPVEMVEFCNKAIAIYCPDKAFAFDVCQLDNGDFKIIEFGCIHNCGFYKADVKKVIDLIIKKINI